LKIKRFIVLYLNYNKENSEALGEVNLALIMQYHQVGHFIKGRMGLKVEVCISFVKETQGIAIITNPENAISVIKGEVGTRVGV
jgi:carbamate kinase